MNSLNILSTLGTSPAASPPRSRTGSSGLLQSQADSTSTDVDAQTLSEKLQRESEEEPKNEPEHNDADVDEKTALLKQEKEGIPGPRKAGWQLLPKRIAAAFLTAVKVFLSAVVAPGHYLIACFYNDEGRFSAVMPLRRLGRATMRRRRPGPLASTSPGKPTKFPKQERIREKDEWAPSLSTETTLISESEPESEHSPSTPEDQDTPSKHTRSKSASSVPDDNTQAKKAIKIKLSPSESLKKRKAQRAKAEGRHPSGDGTTALISPQSLKSPTSPTNIPPNILTKYPRAPAPPRPLIPRRQPSYSILNPLLDRTPKKTLIIDLDETLIHSMAKGGRMSTGHMVEVKLQAPVGAGGVVFGPQVPILYYVHKRPHCDEFLKKVSKWFNLVIFTASVQEYADPVIDWVELERKYFSGRYYRQHCTFRNGAYIKDLSQVEPDLSKVMILDNSPMSYIFHEDNAIPIEGWINDPTDNDLLHLIPFFEGLQYATDVRALLALRLGEIQQTT